MIEQHTHRRTRACPFSLFPVDIIKSAINKVAHADQVAEPAVNRSFCGVAVQIKHEQKAHQSAAEASQCDQIRRQPGGKLLGNPVTQRTLHELEVKGVD